MGASGAGAAAARWERGRNRGKDGGSRGGLRRRSTQAQGFRAGRAAHSNSSSRGNRALTKARFPGGLRASLPRLLRSMGS
jgi:hypothetical protein